MTCESEQLDFAIAADRFTPIVGIAEKHLTTFRDFPVRQLGLSAQMAKTLEGIQSQILKLKPNN